MKRIIVLLLALILCFGLMSCGGGVTEEDVDVGGNDNAFVETDSKGTEDGKTDEELKLEELYGDSKETETEAPKEILVELTLGEFSGVKLLGEFVHSRVVLVWNLVLLDDVLCRNLSVVWNGYERDWGDVSVSALLL